MTTREEMRSLAEEIVGSYADRVAGIAQLRVAVKTQLKELDDAHATMSNQLRADLAEEDRTRQSEAREFMGELGRAVAEGKSAVKTLLGEFDSSHNAMSREMRAELTKGERERQSGARDFRGELGRAIAEGKAATQSLLRDSSEVQAGARDEWQKLTATMQSKRGGATFAVKPLIEEIPERAAEITMETAALSDRVFEYLANHPDGTRMTELEKEFGLARIQMAKVTRNLMDENKVKKQGLLYFAV